MTASAPGNQPVKPVRTLVYLARHSQTPLNGSDVLRGLTDPPLDDAGQRRASPLGATLGSRKPSVVVASPLRRALQTAQPVADRAQLEVARDEHLVDRDCGPWTGVSRDRVIALWGSVDDAPGVEAKSAAAEGEMAHEEQDR